MLPVFFAGTEFFCSLLAHSSFDMKKLLPKKVRDCGSAR